MYMQSCMYLFICDASIIILKGSDKPTLKEIIDYNIRDQVATDWRDLGVQLLPDLFHVQLDIIEENNPTNVQNCCTEMFKYWLKVDTAASWSKLIEALMHINQNHLAECIREIFEGILTFQNKCIYIYKHTLWCLYVATCK